MLETEALSNARTAGAGTTADALPGFASMPRTTSSLRNLKASARHDFHVSTAEPGNLTIVRELLGPAVVAASLAFCLCSLGEELTLPSIALELLAFLLSRQLLGTPRFQIDDRGSLQLQVSLPKMLLRWSLVFSIVSFIALGLQSTQQSLHDVLLLWYVVTPFGLVTGNLVASRLANHWRQRGHDRQRHVVIGATDVGIELAKRAADGIALSRFMGFFDFRDPARLPENVLEKWAGSCDEVVSFVQQNRVSSIYIALPISTTPRISELLQRLHDTTASVYFVPNLLGFDLVQPSCTTINGIPALSVIDTPYRGVSALTKRCMDIAIGSFALLLTGPLMSAIAVAVKLTSPGPVLFKQRRYGLDGEEIFVYKFRSMTVCEDGAAVKQATKSDQRVTSLGRILRRTSMDELPQIFNVLEGNMSVVGPRPHAVAHNEQYRKLISGYMVRHKVRPGMTGWAQVNGCRGETETLDKMRRRVELDIEYLNNWSLLLDLKILAKTAYMIFKDEAY